MGIVHLKPRTFPLMGSRTKQMNETKIICIASILIPHSVAAQRKNPSDKSVPDESLQMLGHLL